MTSESKKRRLNLITGDYPVLQEAFLETVKHLRSDDRLSSLIVLVTSHLLGLHLQRSLADRDVPHINVRFLTLEDLADQVATPVLASDGKRLVPPHAPRQAIRTVVRRLASENRDFYFRAIADRPGFYQAILSTICDLKNACLSPADLEARLGDPDVGKKVNISKVQDVLNIWGGYEAKLKDLNWFDEYDRMRKASELILESKLMRRARALIVYGFYDFNALERRLLQSCFELNSTVCFVPYETGPAFEYARPVIEYLRSNNFVDIPPHVTLSETRPAPVQHLCDHLFNEGEAANSVTDALTVISAPGEVREVRDIVRQMVKESEEHGIDLHEIAILLRNPKSYASLFRETLESLRLSAYIPEGIPLKDTRAGRSLLLLLDILRHDYARQAVMEVTTFVTLRDRDWTHKAEIRLCPMSWDMISMEAGIVGGAHEWEKRLKRLHDDSKREHPSWGLSSRQVSPEKIQAITSLRRFIKKLKDHLNAISRASSWTEKTLKLIDAFTSIVEPDNETAQVLRAVKQLAEIDAIDPAPSQAAFYELAKEALQAPIESGTRFQRSGPAVLDLMAGRGIPFKMVVIPGMVEKIFPPVMRQDAVLLDEERRALNVSLSGRESEPLHLKAWRRLEEEHLLFRLAVGASRRKLLLTYPRLEIATARERLPSSLLLATIQAFSQSQADFRAIEKFEGCKRIPLSQIAVEDPRQTMDRVEYDLATALQEIRQKKPGYLVYLQNLSPCFRCVVRLEAERWGRDVFTRYDGLLSSKEAKDKLCDIYSITSKTVSPTRLEAYATCPFQYLLGSIMYIEPLIEPERVQRITPLDKGELIHSILWEFLTKLVKDRGHPVKVRSEDIVILHEVAERRFGEFEQRGLTGYPVLWRADKESILYCLDQFIDEETSQTDFLPAYFEVRYGMKQKDLYESEISIEDAVPLVFGDRKMLLRGRIDRIDISQDFKQARVIDYKTGRANVGDNDFEAGTSLQLPLYLHAANHILKRLHAGISTEEAEYYHITLRGKKRHIRFGSDALQSKNEELRRILDTIADSIEAGLFFAVPGKHCTDCDFLTICGANRQHIYDLKCGDPRIKDFLKLGEEQGE
jgi:superfamily I DNA/RNA helicase